jgi:hypothetical protein
MLGISIPRIQQLRSVVKLSEEVQQLIREGLSGSTAMIENMQRVDVNDADKGKGIQQYIDLQKSEKSLSPRGDKEIMDELRIMLGMGRSRINQLLNVTKLSEECQQLIREKKTYGSTALAAKAIGGKDHGEDAIKAVAD